MERQDHNVQGEEESRAAVPSSHSCSHEALVHFFLSSPTTHSLPVPPSECIQTPAHYCPCLRPCHIHLSPRLWCTLLMGLPAHAPRPPFLSVLLASVISPWAFIPPKCKRLPNLYLQPDLSPECQTPIPPCLLSKFTGMLHMSTCTASPSLSHIVTGPPSFCSG